MDIEFKDPDYDRLETDGSFTLGFQANIVSLYRRRLAFIRAAPDERDFYALNGLRFEKLKADRAGQYSMRLNDQWRLILEFSKSNTGKVVVVIAVTDYHK